VIVEFIDVSHKDTSTPPEVTLVILEDDYVFFEDIPGTLPLTHDIQHANKLTPRASLLDLSHHKKDPTMHTELKCKLICH